MTMFNDKEKAVENKFAHDKELEFKVNARKNKLLGLWAAQQMDLQGEAAEAYAKEVMKADFERPGDDDVVEKVIKDLMAKGLNITEYQVRAEMHHLAKLAREQLTGG